MPRFYESDGSYENVNEIADRNGLIWDGHYGSPYGVEELIERGRLDAHKGEVDRFDRLFDHTMRLRPRGSGARKPVLAISSPYVDDDEGLRSMVLEFCDLFGLAARVNDPSYRTYRVETTVPIVFWRPDLHHLV